MTVPDTPAPETRLAKIWDAPIRLFHWLLLPLIAFSWWSGEQHEMEWHRLSGYGILALLVFRIYWGFFGGRTARFAQFLRGPAAALSYLRSQASGRHAPAPGHNPIGGWSVILMLGTLVAMVVAGLFAVDVDGLESGPLADYVSFDQGRLASDIHGIIFNLLLALIVLHVAAILFYAVRLRQNLVGPMIHGRRRIDEPVADVTTSPWKALIGIVIAGICAYAVARGFRL